MSLFEDIHLTDSVEIRTSPEKVFDFLIHIIDNESYRKWHPQDHVALRWIKGQPWLEGSVVYAEEYIHGKLHKLKFLITKVVPNRRIEFAPHSRLLRIYFPMNAFAIEPKGRTCVFTTTATMRVGRVVKMLAGNILDKGLAGAKKHMKEEAENLKKILEAQSETGLLHNRRPEE